MGHARRHLGRSSDAVDLHSIGVPRSVTPSVPTSEQKAPGCTTRGEDVVRRVVGRVVGRFDARGCTGTDVFVADGTAGFTDADEVVSDVDELTAELESLADEPELQAASKSTPAEASATTRLNARSSHPPRAAHATKLDVP